jgi:hypothetical protein
MCEKRRLIKSLFLTLADAVHLRPAFGANTFGRRLAVLHFNGFGVAHFPLLPAFHAVTYHF